MFVGIKNCNLRTPNMIVFIFISRHGSFYCDALWNICCVNIYKLYKTTFLATLVEFILNNSERPKDDDEFYLMVK